MSQKLLLCAGVHHPAGWKTHDATGGDFQAVIPPLPPEIKAIEWDQIELIHGIEHFFPWQAKQLLAEIRQVLKPGGLLVLEQPDLEVCVRNLLAPETVPAPSFPGQFDIAGIYGDPTQTEGNPFMAHKWGWTPKTLIAAVLDAGFSKAEVMPAHYHVPWRDFRVEAIK